jgi:alkanesulfonate monooxygenase SsuD/methylene tetrahydromethanopterin reductase-like flavin-dependent oxidoreductase (luciferase family)
MQPFGASEKTIINCAKNGITPWILSGNPTAFRGLCKTYQDTANAAGRNLKFGEAIGAVRAVHFGDTTEQAVDLLKRTNFETFNTVFGGFGFFEAHREPEDEEKYPLDPYTPLPPEEWTAERMLRTKYALAGTVDEVKRSFEELHKMHEGDGELEWFGWFIDQGLMSLDEQLRQIELFAEHIIPEFGTKPAAASAAAE